MIKVYIKQAWQMLRQNKLYSSVYIIGTGMAIAMTMTIALIYYVKIAPVYPETNRDRTMTITGGKIQYLKSESSTNSYLSYQFIRDYLLPLETPEAVTAVLDTWREHPLIELPNASGSLPTTVKYVDTKFWKVFDFKFLNGKPFTEADFSSGIKTAVISKSLSNKLFGTHTAEGQYMSLDGNNYRISGVVDDISFVTPDTYGQVWVPFTLHPEAEVNYAEGFLGSMKAYILARSKADMPQIKQEALGVVQKINNSQDNYEFSIYDQPTPYWQTVFRKHTNQSVDWGEVFKTLGVMLLALLIVPAVNLAGLVSSRMDRRLPEMGLRKSFGASRGVLLNQILVENLLFTILGGIAGLIISYIIMYTSSSWILTIFDRWPDMAPEDARSFFTPGMLFNPVIFLIAFGVCFILNLLSAVIPAYNGLKKNIIYSLSNNK